MQFHSPNNRFYVLALLACNIGLQACNGTNSGSKPAAVEATNMMLLPQKDGSISTIPVSIGYETERIPHKPIAFHGVDKNWKLIIDENSAQFYERSSLAGQIWESKDLHQGSFSPDKASSATFWSTHVVAGEAADQSVTISLKFLAKNCKEHGRDYPITVELRFSSNDEVNRGCGYRLP